MKRKGSYNAKIVDLQNRHDEYMRKKYELKKLKNNKTGLVKEDIKNDTESNSLYLDRE